MVNLPNIELRGSEMEKIQIKNLVKILPKAFLPEKAKGINATIGIHAEGEGGGDWVIKIQNEQCEVLEGPQAATDLYLASDTQTIMDVFTGKLDGMRAFMKGDIQFKGNMGLAMKLSKLFSTDKNLLNDL
jgi:putative sterol carrier protein